MAVASQERFLDLLDAGSDEEDDDVLGELPEIHGAPVAMSRQESSHGPLHWNTRCSAELQTVVDSLCIDELMDLGFSVTIADPSQPDCPLVACSIGFTQLTGYTVQEIVGRNCRFLLNGVPSGLIDDEVRMKCRGFCLSSNLGEDWRGSTEHLPEGVEKPWVELPKGEMICVQTNARKTGELFRNMFYLKQVELDESRFILGLQAGLPEESVDGDLEMKDLQRKCQLAFGHLDENMTAIEQVLAAQFWYSAPIRRQV
mmetsp:Transcript_97321/g.208818  ORF Transcript_97321/g.208818 Transcript_97321/m.208818 type:complete len:257 (-) Transcript_97321:148-918(-)